MDELENIPTPLRLIQLQQWDTDCKNNIGGIYLNSDLITSMQPLGKIGDGTLIHMSDGKGYKVVNSLSEVIDKIQEWSK